MSENTNFEVVGSLDLPLGDGANIVNTGNLAFISDESLGTGGGGLFIIDVSDPQAPSLLSQTPLGLTPDTDIATDVAIAGNLAFLTVSDGETLMDGLAIFDVSEPINPNFLSNVAFDTSVISDIAVDEASSRFISSNPGAETITFGSFADPNAPIVFSTIDIPGGASEVVFTPGGLGLVVGDIGDDPTTQSSTISIVDPISEMIIGSLDFTSDIDGSFDPFGIAVTSDNQFAFVSGGFQSTEIAVFDISDPNNPMFETTVGTAGTQAFGISLVDDLLFVSNPVVSGTPPNFVFDGGFVTVVDVSDPTDPNVVDTADLSPLGTVVDVSAAALDDGTIRAVAVNADFSAVGGSSGGVSVIQPVPEPPAVLGLVVTALVGMLFTRLRQHQ